MARRKRYEKTWSYRELTDQAEARIRSLMDPARETPLQLRREWAYGVFLGWQVMTMGYIDAGDISRLEALVSIEKPPATVPTEVNHGA